MQIISVAGMSAPSVAVDQANDFGRRFISATWDLSEVERVWKERIVGQNLLVSKLAIPQ